MIQKESAEETFKKLKKKLDLNIEGRFELSEEEIEYLTAIVLIELDKGKREGTLSEMDTKFIESLKTAVEKKFFPKKNVYKSNSPDSNIDEKI